MRSYSWISLLRRVPEHYHAKLLLVCSSGHEINLTSIFHMEEEYMIIRGRLSGSTDAGTFVFLPFDQLVYIGFREEIKENEMQKLWGDGPSSQVAAAPPVHEPPPAEAPPPPRPAAEPPLSTLTPAAAPVPGKATLLERLRKGRPQQ